MGACALAGVAATSGTSEAANGPTMDIQILSFNDFHGNLEPPAGSSGRIVTANDPLISSFAFAPNITPAGLMKYKFAPEISLRIVPSILDAPPPVTRARMFCTFDGP